MAALLALTTDGVDALIRALRARSTRVLGPVGRDGAIVYDDLASVADLPQGWHDEQAPAHYRARPAPGDRSFGFAVGPDGLKRLVFPPALELFRARRDAGGNLAISGGDDHAERVAVVGARACDLHALVVQDRVFAHDEGYRRRRAALTLVAVQCSTPSASCFCPSTGTGPAITPDLGADVVLTELDDGAHRFVARPDTELGRELLAAVLSRLATPSEIAAADAVVARAAASITRSLPATAPAVRDLLATTLEHPVWDELGARCLSCTNCTAVCPTCFCSAVDDLTELDGEAVRVRRWDSCFTIGHSYMHGGAVHPDIRSRYRQWLTHKLGTWWDQFGTSGCVGCGRCITWCPAGIDLTDAVRRLQEVQRAPGA